MNQTKPKGGSWFGLIPASKCSYSDLAPRMLPQYQMADFLFIAFGKFNKPRISHIKTFGQVNSTCSLSRTTDNEKVISS